MLHFTLYNVSDVIMRNDLQLELVFLSTCGEVFHVEHYALQNVTKLRKERAQMAELQIKEIEERCYKCKLPSDYAAGNLTLEQARTKCANCHFGSLRLYKFDIIVQLLDKSKAAGTTEKKKPATATGEGQKITFNRNTKGKGATYLKRYGAAIRKLQDEGKTVRQIAELLGISPTSVIKVSKELKQSDDSLNSTNT